MQMKDTPCVYVCVHAHMCTYTFLCTYICLCGPPEKSAGAPNYHRETPQDESICANRQSLLPQVFHLPSSYLKPHPVPQFLFVIQLSCPVTLDFIYKK